MSNKEKVALVTGASSGIGKAIATKLSASGYQVFGASRRAVVADRGIQALKLDVTDNTSVTTCVAEVLGQAGRIDLLVNSAGFALVAALEESTMTQVQSIFETNVFGVMRMTRAVLPAMRAQGAGRIVNISSIVGFLPAAYSGLYASSKHAVEGYSESLDHEVRTRGIRVCLIEPGFTMSNIAHNMPEPDAPIDIYAAGRNNILNIFSAALAKGADPDMVADTVVIAASAKVPKVRYTVGREAAALAKLRRFLPTAMFDKSFRTQFRLDVV